MISILIPVYNTPAIFLKECIDSCLNQTIDDYEIVIVDNGSDDTDTISVLKNYSLNKKIFLYNCPRQQNKKNLSIALNYGLQKCKYDLVARMDSDDLMLPERLAKQKLFMDRNPDVDIVGGQIHIFPEGTTTNHPFVINKDYALQTYWLLNHPTVMFRKNKITKIGCYKEQPEMFAEDYELWTKALRNNFKIRNIPDVVVLYRLHNNNLTRKTEKNSSYFEEMEKERQKIRDVYNDIS